LLVVALVAQGVAAAVVVEQVVIVLLLGHQGVAHLLKPLCHCVLEPHIP
jgi:hypothetical protein